MHQKALKSTILKVSVSDHIQPTFSGQLVCRSNMPIYQMQQNQKLTFFSVNASTTYNELSSELLQSFTEINEQE